MTITNICYCFTSHGYPFLYFDQIKKSVQFRESFSYQQVVILITLIGDWLFISFASTTKCDQNSDVTKLTQQDNWIQKYPDEEMILL